VNQATSSIVTTNIATIIEATDTIAKTNEPTIIIETTNTTIVLVAMTRTPRTASPTRSRMIARVITSKKKQQYHAQCPVLSVERGHLVWKKELLLLKISSALSVPVLLLLEQQELR
jgi:hypothetical protein